MKVFNFVFDILFCRKIYISFRQKNNFYSKNSIYFRQFIKIREIFLAGSDGLFNIISFLKVAKPANKMFLVFCQVLHLLVTIFTLFRFLLNNWLLHQILFPRFFNIISYNLHLVFAFHGIFANQRKS